MTEPIVLRLPWFTLYGLPAGPSRLARLRCLVAMVVHEAVELVAGSTVAHGMAAARRYSIGAPVVTVPASLRNRVFLIGSGQTFPSVSAAPIGNRVGVELWEFAGGTANLDTYESCTGGTLAAVYRSNPISGDWELVGDPAGTAAALTAADVGAVDLTAVGAVDGVASLDSGGKVPASQLPSTIMEYQGVWNASTNSPTLADGTGNAGDVYRVGTGGTRDLGSGSQVFDVGDLVLYDGAVWQRSDGTDLTGAQLAALIHASTGKTTPVDADELALVDSAASNGPKKLAWANLKATLKAYFDGLYPSGSGTSSGTNTGDQTITLTGDVTGSGTGSFAAAIGSGKVTSSMIADGTIVNADVSASAAIAASKLSGLPWPDRATFSCSVWYPSTPPSSWSLVATNTVGGGYAVTAATNDQSITYARLPLRAGTYALRFTRRTESACGIATFTLGGTSIGTIDCYSASNTNDVVSTITGITAVSADGFYDLVITNPTKNASAGNYALKPQVIDLYRTGA